MLRRRPRRSLPRSTRRRRPVPISLGGSAINNLNDNLNLFGLAPGTTNVFAAVYSTFGQVDVQQYPKLIPTFPKVDDILDLSFLQSLSKKGIVSAPADMPMFTASADLKQIVSKKSWAINFQTGSAAFASDALTTLEQIKNGALIADELAISIHGHTDNTGDPAGNMELSHRRAKAVRDWLMKASSSDFPVTRFAGPAPDFVYAHGQNNPVANNSTEDGRSRNRRVDIVLGTE
jgi:OOP family OmpA-OmpF porin